MIFETTCPDCGIDIEEDIDLDLASVLDFIEKQLWSPSDWERLQNSLAVAVKPRGAE